MPHGSSLPIDVWLLRKKQKTSFKIAMIGITIAAVPVAIDFCLHAYPLFHGEQNFSALEEVLSQAGLLALLVAIAVTLFQAAAEYEDEFASLRAMIGGSSEVTCLGNAAEVATSIGGWLREAVSVRNTFVTFGLSSPRGQIAAYREAMHPLNRKAIISELLERGTWTDMFSKESVSDPRLRNSVEELERKFQRYDAFYLKEQYPIVNFVLLEYQNKESVVLFGWGFHPQEKVGNVFSSKDAKVYGFFERYWKTLEDDALPVMSAGHMAITGHDIAGLWFDVAEDSGVKTSDIALIQIGIDAHRRIVVEGRIFDPSTYELKNTFHSKSAQLQNRKLWFVSVSNVSKALGAGYYDFVSSSHFNPFLGPHLVVEEFAGSFIEGNAPIKIKGQRIEGLDTFPQKGDDEKKLLQEYWSQGNMTTPEKFHRGLRIATHKVFKRNVA